MKRFFHAFLLLLTALFISACTTSASAVKEETSVQIANPFTTYKDIESAENTAGFSLAVPEQIAKSYSANVYRAMQGKMLEVICDAPIEKG